MQMGFARYNQLKNSLHKNKMNTVLRFSIYKNFTALKNNIFTLITYINDDVYINESINMINNKISKLNYNPSAIELKKQICMDLYNHGKYYLD